MNAKMSIKAIENLIKENKAFQSSVIKLGVLSIYFLWNSFEKLRYFLVDKDYRSILFLEFLNSKNVHQTTPYTQMNRYPAIFSACRDYFFGKQDIKILSFGCSTGEEVLTLRKYFPNAQIIGAEINKRSFSICKKHQVDEKITFIHSSPSEIKKYGPFDAVFCMAVLQRKPHLIASNGITSLKKIYPFEKFDQQLVKLDDCIKPYGLLVLHYVQYRLCDSSIALKYESIGDYSQGAIYKVFDQNSKLINNPIPPKSIYKKVNK